MDDIPKQPDRNEYLHPWDRLQGADKKIHTQSILNSALWLVGLLAAALTAALFSGHNSFIIKGLFILFVLSILFVFFWYSFFAIREPNRLQSEKFQLQYQQLLKDERHQSEFVALSPATSNQQAIENERK